MPSAVGPTSTATPTNPIAMPRIAPRGSRSPKKRPLKIATQTGSIAMRIAVIPDGIVCSAKATMPIPPPSSRPPTISESRHSRRVGHSKSRPPRIRDRPSRITPARTKRVAAMRNGGMVWTATAIAR